MTHVLPAFGFSRGWLHASSMVSRGSECLTPMKANFRVNYMDTIQNVRNAIAVARCSTDEQARTATIEKQIEVIRNYAKLHAIKIVDELRLEGKSATYGEHEPYLRQLIARKEQINDFDLIIFMDYSR